MKIGYVIFHDITKNDGVTKKIKGQVDEWRKLKVEVNVFCFLPKIGDSLLIANQYEYGGFLKMRFLKNEKFLNEINFFDPDIIYFRYDTWNINLINVFKNRISISELNSLDLEEFKLLVTTEKSFKSIVRYLGYLFGRNFLLSRLSALVSVTNEIINDNSFAKFKKSNIIVPNGIDLNEYPPIKLRKSDSNKIALFFIGTPNQPWQGFDVIQEWSKNLPLFDFHIVGMKGSDTENLFFHGYLQKVQYLEVLKLCHVCIGTLALFRKNMEEACPLKVREYLAYGYPTIIGYKDTSYLNGKAEFILQLDEDNLFEYKIIREFVLSMKNRVVRHDEIHCLSTVFLENSRVNFMKSLHKEYIG